MIELVLGGARSGKSRYAEQQVVNTPGRRIYIATATAGDGEMTERIALHRRQRADNHWLTVEEPIELAQVLEQQCRPDTVVLVDCLTLWLSNCLFSENADWQQQKKRLLQLLSTLPGTVIFVSNEVGQGIVPLGEINRRFVDESGWLHQAVAELADRVTFVTAGIPQSLKGT